MRHTLPSPLRLWLSVAVLLSSAAMAQPFAAPPQFDRAAWQADYATLKLQLEQRYANLAWFASPQGGVDLPALDRYTRAALALAGNDDQAAGILGGFVRSFHDDHFSALAAARPGIPEPAPPAMALAGLDAAAGCAALGYSSDMRVSFSAPFESLPGFRMQADGFATAFRAGVLKTPGGRRLGIVRIRNFHQKQYASVCVDAWKSLRSGHRAIDADSIDDAVGDAWYAALAAQLRRFQDEAVAAVLVDVGQNNGGDDSGDAMARLFSTRPVHSSRLLISQSTEASGYLDEQIGDMQHALDGKPSKAVTVALRSQLAAFAQSKQATRAPCAMDWVWRERRDWHADSCRRLVPAGTAGGPLGYLPRMSAGDIAAARRLHWPLAVQSYWGAWGGPVYLLTDAKTYSAAEMFSATMRDNHIARTIGATTGGAGCGFMIDAKPVVLPHSQLRFRIPNCVRLRANGSDEVAGIAPDLPLLPIEGESRRAWATRLLRTIGSDLAAHPLAAQPPR